MCIYVRLHSSRHLNFVCVVTRVTCQFLITQPSQSLDWMYGEKTGPYKRPLYSKEATNPMTQPSQPCKGYKRSLYRVSFP